MMNNAKTPEYQAGFDCGRNGPNMSNCDFRHFATPEMTEHWKRGKRDAERERGSP
jgi:hypothetical protein